MLIGSVLRKIRRKIKRKTVSKEKEKYNHLLSLPPKTVVDDNSYVLFVHGAQYGGAPLLGVDIARELCKQGKKVLIVSLGFGPLISSYASVTNVQVCTNEAEMDTCIELLSEYGFKKAICNGALTGKIIPFLKKHNFHIVSLIHELPGVINYFNAQNDVKRLVCFSDKMIYPATFVKNQMEERYGKNPNTIILHQGLANVADNTLTKDEAKRIVAEQYGFDKQLALFINVATINERKGFDLFVEMAVNDNQAIYLWIGDGIDGRFGKRIKHKYPSFPTNLVLPGYVKDKGLLNTVYRAADILLLTSREEPFGTIVLEAFSRETPVAAFKGCGGYEDVVIPSKTGIIVSPFNINEMIMASHSMVNNKKVLEKIHADCRQMANDSNFEEYCRTIIR